MNIYFLKCAIHRAICMIQHLQSFGILTLIHTSIWWMWNNFQSFICETERIWDKGTKTVHNHPMQHTHTQLFSMKQLYELSSLKIKISLEIWTQKYMPYSQGVQLISDNNPVHSVFVFCYNTNFITAYLFFSGEVAALFSRNLAGYCTICDWFLKE